MKESRESRLSHSCAWAAPPHIQSPYQGSTSVGQVETVSLGPKCTWVKIGEMMGTQSGDPILSMFEFALKQAGCGAIQVTLFYVLPGGAGAQETSETKYTCVCAQSLGCVQFFATPMDCSPPGSSAHGIVQAKILEQLLFPSPEDLPRKEIEPGSPTSPVLADGFFTTEPATREAWSRYNIVSSIYQALP